MKSLSKVFLTVTILLVVLSSFSVNAGQAINSDGNTLAGTILGQDITASDILFSGKPGQGAVFTDADFLDFSEGIIISTGDAASVFCSEGTKLNNKYDNPGSPELTTIYRNNSGISNGQSFDAASLQFTVIPTSNVLSFRYLFASEDFNTTDVKYHDVFAIYINGQNVAKIPDTNTAVNIGSIQNTSYYIDNTGGTKLGFSGYTKALSCETNVTPNVPVTVKIAIADVWDGSYDSAIFIEAGSLNFISANAPNILSLEGGSEPGEDITVTNDQSGRVYIVPKGIYTTKDSLDGTTNKKTVDCSANMPVTIGTNGLPGGVYQIYAVNSQGKLSLPSRDIIIESDDTDTEEPYIISVTSNATDWTSNDIILTVNAVDSMSGIKEYSFDGGVNWQNSSTKTYSENTVIPMGSIMVKDNAGNVSIYNSKIVIDRIDKNPPVIRNISGNTATWTNENVILHIEADDTKSGIYKYSFDGGVNWQNSSTKTYSENTVIPMGSIMVKDNAGNVSIYNSEIFIDRIDKNPPVIRNISGNTATWTNENVILHIEADDTKSGIYKYSFDGGVTWQNSSTKTYSENTVIPMGSIMVKDNAGNVSIYNSEIVIDRIDKNPPAIRNISGNATIWTNENVILHIEADDTKSGIYKYSFDGGVNWQNSSTKTYSENTVIPMGSIMVKDNAGNVSIYDSEIFIDRIDKNPPVIRNISGNTATWTNENVILHIEADDTMSEIYKYSFDGGVTWQNSSTKTYSENTVIPIGSIMVKDNAGNVSIYNSEIVIDRIDKNTPVIRNISGNTATWTNENVILNIESEDTLSGIQEYSFDGGVNWQNSSTKTYSENTVIPMGSIMVKDNAGNVSIYNNEVVIDRIDKSIPLFNRVSRNITEWTSEDVTITIDSVDNGSGINEYSFDGGVTWQKSASKAYLLNTLLPIGTVKVKDFAGNTNIYSKIIIIDNIDKSEPREAVIPNIDNYTHGVWHSTSQTVEANFTASEGCLEKLQYKLNGGVWTDGNSLLFDEDGVNTVSFRVVDALNRVGKVKTVIVQIDKIAPQISVTGNPDSPVQIAVLNINTIAGISGYKIFLNDSELSGKSYEVMENGLYSFRIENLAGAHDSYAINVTNIDRAKPEVIINTNGYESSNWTNKNVVLGINNITDNLGITSLEYSLNNSAFDTFGGKLEIKDDTVSTYRFRAVSESGMESEIVDFTVMIDKTVPDLTAEDIYFYNINDITKKGDLLTSGMVFNKAIKINVNIAEEGSGVKRVWYRLGNNEFCSADKLYFDLINDFAGDIIIYAEDNAGNVTSSENYVVIKNISIDSVPPSIEFIGSNPVSGSIYSDYVDLQMKISDMDSGLESVTIYINGEKQKCSIDSFQLGSYNKNIVLERIGDSISLDDTYILKIIVCDSAGNESENSVTIVITYSLDYVTKDNEQRILRLLSIVDEILLDSSEEIQKKSYYDKKQELLKLIDKIDEVNDESKQIDETLLNLSEQTVTLNDKDDIWDLEKGIQSLINSNNLTISQRNNLEENKKRVDLLKQKMDETKVQLEKVLNLDNYETKEDNLNQIKLLLSSDNLTNVQRQNVEGVKQRLLNNNKIVTPDDESPETGDDNFILLAIIQVLFAVSLAYVMLRLLLKIRAKI